MVILLGVLVPLPAVAAPVLSLPAQARPAPACADNANRYVDCGNGTVTDTVTGLIWLANADCFGMQNYPNALSMVGTLATGACGLTDGSFAGDWRLPTEAEWQTTIAQAVALDCTFSGMGNPPSLTDTAGTGCFDTEGSPVFSGVQIGRYWSSTAIATSPDFAHRVFLSDGSTNVFTKANTYFAWPVRGGR